VELSEDHKQRIIEEESQRLAEEKFREKVRRDLLKMSSTPPLGNREAEVPVSPQFAASEPPRQSRGTAVAVGLAGIVLVAAALLFGRGLLSSPAEAKSEVTPALKSKSSVTVGAVAPAPEAPVKLTTSQIAESATPSVVVIESIDENGSKSGHGSGYVFASDGTVVTNYHVVRGATRLNVRLTSGATLPAESVLAYDVDHDIAVLKTSGASSLSPLATQDTGQPKVGDKVVAIGAPLGLESTVSEGIVSAMREVGNTHIIQTTTSISPGSSGGPLLNEFGKVIGLTTAYLRDGQNLNFVMSARHITALMERKRPMALAEMLSETKATTPMAPNTFMVPARGTYKINITVPMQQGALFEGSYDVSGGRGNDVDVQLRAADNQVVLDSGRVSGSGQIRIRLPRGSYVLYFDNHFSTFSSKSVSPDLKLTYYR
jgi:S1-C subfamily serine protease